jgi:hypothetical protein
MHLLTIEPTIGSSEPTFTPSCPEFGEIENYFLIIEIPSSFESNA